LIATLHGEKYLDIVVWTTKTYLFQSLSWNLFRLFKWS
jgi:hypothetical protein